MQIQSTQDYKQFKFIGGNRAVDKNHLNTLVASIKRKNLLPFTPIIVNEKNEIVDGQHRITAAELLQTPIYYIFAKGVTLKDVVLLNSNMKQWRIADYLESYISQGLEPYTKLKVFADKFNLSISNAMAILSIGDSVKLEAPLKQFKEGAFKIPNYPAAVEMARRLGDIIPYTEENTYKDRDFIRAVHRMYHEADIKHDDFMEKIKASKKPIYRRMGVKEYLRELEDIYNIGLKGNRVRFY